MVNSPKIKGRIVELGLTQQILASKLNKKQCTISQKINNIKPMSLDEAFDIAQELKITKDEFTVYFFIDKTA